jgi:hypothetical protein
LAAKVKLVTKDMDFSTLVTSLMSEKGYSVEEAKELFLALNPTYVEKNIPFLKVVQQVVKYEGFNPLTLLKIVGII